MTIYHFPIAEAAQPATLPVAAEETALLLPLSGRTAEALRDRARSFAHFIRTKHAVTASNIAYVAATRRQHFEHRLAVVGTRREELSSLLWTLSPKTRIRLICWPAACAPLTGRKWLSSVRGKARNGGAWVANF